MFVLVLLSGKQWVWYSLGMASSDTCARYVFCVNTGTLSLMS